MKCRNELERVISVKSGGKAIGSQSCSKGTHITMRSCLSPPDTLAALELGEMPMLGRRA